MSRFGSLDSFYALNTTSYEPSESSPYVPPRTELVTLSVCRNTKEDVSPGYPVFPVFSIRDTLCIDDNTTTITH